MGTSSTLTSPAADSPVSHGTGAIHWWRRWRLRLSAGVLDQAIVSGANFGLNVLLARWLSPAGYGSFAIAFALIVLIGGPHAALLIDPLNVVGARSFRHRPHPYLRAVVALHAIVTAAAAALMVGAAFWRPLPAAAGLTPRWFVTLAFAAPLVLSPWLLRSACYVEMRPARAVAGSSTYAITLFVTTAAAHAAGLLTPAVALGVMGAAAAVAAAAIATWLRLMTPSSEPVPIQLVAREHWTYGRWILGASIAHGVANGLYLPIVATLVGIEQSAALRALQNLVLPLQQILAGIALVAYPSMARQVAERGPSYLKRRAIAFVLAYVGCATAYAAVLAVAAHPLLTAMYGRGYYAGYAALVPVFGAAAVAMALAQSLSILVRAGDRPHAVLWSKVAAAAWLGVAGLALVRQNGVGGAIAGLGGGAAVESIVLAVALRYSAPRTALASRERVLDRPFEA